MEKNLGDTEKTAEKTVRVKFPIGAKFAIIISVIVIAALGATTFFVTYFLRENISAMAESNNLAYNMRSATAAENEFRAIRSNVFQLFDVVQAAEQSAALEDRLQSIFFEQNQNIAAVTLTGSDDAENGASGLRLLNERFFADNELDVKVASEFLGASDRAVERCVSGETLALNAAPFFNLPVMALLFPRTTEDGVSQACVVIFSDELLSESIGQSSTSTSFVVNDEGYLLIHPDFELVRYGVNFADMPLVSSMVENADANRQILFTNEDGKRYFGAYQKLDTAGIGVLTMTEEAVATEAVTRLVRNNVFLAIAVLCVAIAFVLIFSRSVSQPLARLTDAAGEIADGKFEIDLQAKSQDEIGVLTQSFVNMGRGLAERERLRDMFGRFTNKEIAERAARGEIAVGGERKDCTIFFSDIRGFTAISDKLSPEEVVGFLNVYLGRMVQCIVDEQGTIDKFEGDAIMAIWGAPIGTGDPTVEARRCVRAALAMRASLREFNKDRGGERTPIIKIGCGINSGPVIAGQMGSEQKMEYTVIGDTVNFASRTEALNKPFGTDILITENTWELIKDEVLVEEMPPVTVKGKEGLVRMFAVVNMPGAADIPGCGPDGPKSLAEVREMLGIPTPDLQKVNPNEEEVKYNIKGNKK